MFETKAEDFLERLKKLKKLIANKVDEKEEWEVFVIGMSSQISERTQGSSNGQRLEKAVLKYMEEVKKIDDAIYELMNERKEKIKFLERLNDVNYDILYKIYVKDFNIQDIADVYDRTYSWATSLHNRSKKKLQKLLDELI